MNPVVKAQLKSFSESNPSHGLDESNLFEVFSCHCVLNGIHSENVDPFKVHLQSTEFGIDGVALMIQGDLCIDTDDVSEALSHGTRHEIGFNMFQAKTSEKLDYGKMSTFFDGVYDFFTNQYESPSLQLKELMDAKDRVYDSSLKKNPSLKLFYVTTGSNEISSQIKKLIEATETRLDDLNIFDKIQVCTVGAKSLQDGFRSATNSISKEIKFKNPLTLPEHPKVKQAFIGYLTANELMKLTSGDAPDGGRRINRAVFFDNVRDFNDASEINKSILAELRNGDQSSFVFKNNGVTAVAKTVSRKGDDFTLDDYQIVNGCQTCNILFQAGDDAIENVFVPFRLIESQEAEFVSTVIVGTNKQNEVKEDQFWALRPFMKDLEEFSKQQKTDNQLFIERREHQYRSEPVERTRITKPSDLVKAIAALFLFQPHRAARDYRGIRKDFSGELFQDDHEVVPYYIAALLSNKLDFAIRNKRVPRDWAIYKFYVLSMIGRQATGGKKIFSMKRNEQSAICAKLEELAIDEEALIEEFERAAKVLDGEIGAAKLETREQLRDYIRSESVAEVFKEKTFTST